MANNQKQLRAKILVIAGIWSVIIGVIIGVATWFSLLSRYMYVEDLDMANSWGFDDYTLHAVSGETPFDQFSYSLAGVSVVVGVLFILIGLLLRRGNKTRIS